MSITNKITKFRCSKLAARNGTEKNILQFTREAKAHYCNMLGASRC